MGGSAIRSNGALQWRFNVPTRVALERINARFTSDEVASWRRDVREQLRQRAPLSELARTIGLDDVAPGSGDAFSTWLDQDWTPAAARRLRSLLWLLARSGDAATFDWEACGDWSDFAIEVQRGADPGRRDVLVRTPHP